MTQTAKLPTLMFVDDYHQDQTIKEVCSWLGLKIKTKELGYCMNNGGYCFIVYENRLPVKEELNRLKKEFDVEFNWDD